jgi:hypothetical protein
MMPDEGTAVLGDQRIQRVDRFRIDVAGPGSEHPDRPQLAAMLVRHDVVRIVWPGALVQERADRSAGECLAGDDTV